MSVPGQKKGTFTKRSRRKQQRYLQRQAKHQDKTINKIINQEEEKFSFQKRKISQKWEKFLINAFGFAALLHLSVLHNAALRVAAMPTSQYWGRPTNAKFHDLTTTRTPPPNLRSLLGLGLKFIPTPYSTTPFNRLNDPQMGISHIERSLRLRCFFLRVGYPPPNNEYNPKLHVPSIWEPPDELFPDLLKKRVHNFSIQLYKLFRPRKTIPNLAPHQRRALEYLRNQKDFIIATCDKNLGPSIIERDKYIRLAYRDHLLDTTTYQRLSTSEAKHYASENQNRLLRWLDAFKEELNDQEYTFVLHHYDSEATDTLPYFYLTMKVHKPILVTRPIVSFPGSTFHALGIWVDTHLQTVAKSFDSYVESSFSLLHEIKDMHIPSNARLFTCDANSMYTNIDTDSAITAIEDYLTANQHLFPTLPVTPVMEALKLIMYHNAFQFGDTFWLQKTGTAMGAPPAPTYANISFAIYELVLLPKYKDFLLLYKRYIDDIFAIWLTHENYTSDTSFWKAFDYDLNNWGGLTWKINNRSDSVTFLDVNITIRDNALSYTMSEKAENFHLYLPVRSAHPPGVLQGLVSGYIYRARLLCSDIKDTNQKIQDLWSHLKNRGYASASLHPIFQKALQGRREYSPPSADPTAAPPAPHWLFKLPYHPQNPTSSEIRRAWDNTVAFPTDNRKPLHRVDIKWKPIGERRFIVCYTRHQNIGNYLSYRKIKPDSGPSVSSIFDSC